MERAPGGVTSSAAGGGLDAPTLVLGAFALILMAGVFVLDVLTPPEVTASALYSIVIFYSALIRPNALVVGVGVSCSVLTFVEVFLGSAGASDVVGVNKLVAIVTIWVATALVLFVKSSVAHVEQARDRIEAESVKLETALEHAPSAMLMVDGAGTVLLVNRQAEQLFGYPRRQLLGESVELLVPERARGEHGELRARLLAGPGTRPVGASASLVARHKDGAEVPVDLALNPIETPDGLRVMVSIVDVRERQRAEAHRLEAERLARELQLAERIQTSILPRPPLAPGIEIAARMIPATEVGGDYYDVVPAADGCWIAIGDVSGHGLEAGMVSLMVQSATSAILRSVPDISPVDAIAGINAILHDNVRKRLARNDFVTFNLLRYRRDGTVAHCGAHEDILVWRAATRTVELHPTEGAWLALDPEARWQVRELRLLHGDVMVLLTDGLIENRNGCGEVFGLEAVKRLLAERAGEGSGALPGELVGELVQESLRWSPRPEDDMTVVALRHHDAW
jgi:sigma-B regulation protein RsbU (phosphoserine phosphatase)